MKRCTGCGAVISDMAHFCEVCGKPCDGHEEEYLPEGNAGSYRVYQAPAGRMEYIPSAVPTGRLRSKWVSFFLCLFLGFLGAHKFYEGKIWMGILYIFTMALFGIGWIVDMIKIFLIQGDYYYTY